MVSNRSHYIPFNKFFLLEEEMHFVAKSLDTPYLVGSALQHDKYRDVDVRVIMDDNNFKALFGSNRLSHHAYNIGFWHHYCHLVNYKTSERTGLNIDFQIIPRSKVTEEEWEKPRIPIGMYRQHKKEWNPWWFSGSDPETE